MNPPENSIKVNIVEKDILSLFSFSFFFFSNTITLVLLDSSSSKLSSSSSFCFSSVLSFLSIPFFLVSRLFTNSS